MVKEKPISLDRPLGIQSLDTYFNMLVNEGQLLEAMEPYLVEEAGVEQIEVVAMLTSRCMSLRGEERDDEGSGN
jgi:hypothetical protein